MMVVTAKRITYDGVYSEWYCFMWGTYHVHVTPPFAPRRSHIGRYCVFSYDDSGDRPYGTYIALINGVD